MAFVADVPPEGVAALGAVAGSVVVPVRGRRPRAAPRVGVPGRVGVRALLLLPAALDLVLTAAIAQAEQPGEPHELLARARERVVDLDRAGPFTLRYNLRLPDGRTGTFVRRQRDPANYREDLQVGPLEAALGAAGGARWRSRGDEAPELRWFVATLLDVRARLRSGLAVPLAAAERRSGGTDFLELTGESRGGRVGWRALLSSPGLDPGLVEESFVACVYVGWKELPGVGRLPDAARLFVQAAPALDMTLVSATNRAGEPAELAPPPDALPRPGCAGEEKPKLVSRVPPEYSDAARVARAAGPVVLAATIAADGSVTDVRHVYGPRARERSRDRLIDAAIAAVSRWRYEPARCGGTPAATELTVVVSFDLQ